MKKPRTTRGLVTQSLEHISRDIFSKYSTLITQLIERSSGVYALYDGTELYYVGRATSLRSRVKQHLRDKHDDSWTHFSIFLVSNDDHIGEIESLLIRIAKPRGNSVKPKGRDSKIMHKELQKLIKEKQSEEFNDLFSNKKENKRKKKTSKANVTKKRNRSSHPENMVGMVQKRKFLHGEYNGIQYKAVLTPEGYIIYENEKYNKPTTPAKIIVKGKTNGWHFWRIKNKNNEWVKLKDYK